MIDRIKSTLNKADIPFMLRNEKLEGQAAGEMPPVICWPEIFVQNEATYQQAMTLIEPLLQTGQASNLAWVCPKCHEHLEPQFEVCWACQSEPAEI